jgi:cell division protein FtsQ
MSPVAAPADRRFRRAHLKPARKRGPWRLLVRPLIRYGLVTLAAVYAAYRVAAVAGHARVLRIDHIVVRGNQRLSSGEVIAVLNGLRGQNIVRADLTAWRRRLLSSPWVRDAVLRRLLPSTVEVLVSERAPIGIGRINRGLYLVDDRGVVIDEYGPQYADVDLPIIDGLTSVAADMAADGSRAELASRVIAALLPQPSVARRLSQIDVTDLHNAAVTLSGDPAVIYVGEDRFLQRLQSYLDLSAELRVRVPDIDYVDLRFDDRIYVRPAGKPGNGGTARVASR